jgi:transketolase
MRNAFSKALVEAARADGRVLLLTGDHGYSLFDTFRRECPRQFINAGVAEQNMVGVAAGLAKGGLRPVVYGLSAFVPIRVLEQIKLDVCYEGLAVVFIGDGAGIVYSTLGSSHQSTEDVAALRSLPNMRILSPGDPSEMRACMDLALSADGPVYVRMGKADKGPVHLVAGSINQDDLRRGKLLPLRQGAGPVGWIATGSMLTTALGAADHWPGSAVWSAPCLKPISATQVAAICRDHDVIITLEEHSTLGGLGSIISEIAASRAPTWICQVGTQDRFSRYCGSYEYLLREHGLDLESIIEQVAGFVDERGLDCRPSSMAA